ncbi:site-specific integrase [Variovorax paradoxus]|uniref:site-specific integrase n=1 Tax=Variovorax paradoxus TaxID=34073 RepID=UPI00247FD3C1|nr:site-specific integrase [Variovorax paradoxus]WGT64961.1 site-specific integrase [Variovorax paradoxus]
MAGKRQRPNGWEYVIKRAGLLDKPIYLTFADEKEGDAFVAKVEKLLDKGIVPTELQVPSRIVTITDLVREYERDAHPKQKDRDALGTIIKAKGAVRLTSIDAGWVDDWISEMKRIDKLAPATIRAKVGALARCTDWGMRKGHVLLPDHPLRTLPDGYAQYTKTDEAIAGKSRVDVERDRRLEPGEFEKVSAVIVAGVLPRKQRPLALDDPKALWCMFVLAVESAMRMREMYTLTLDQVDLAKRTAFLDKTKNGDKRQVPLSSVAMATLTAYLELRVAAGAKGRDVLFPWWDGDINPKKLHKTTDYLSKLYVGIFEAAGCANLTFHDLRHEATSRLFEKTTLSETQIMKITGHKSHRMMMRYANLRGSDLAARLW